MIIIIGLYTYDMIMLHEHEQEHARSLASH